MSATVIPLSPEIDDLYWCTSLPIVSISFNSVTNPLAMQKVANTRFPFEFSTTLKMPVKPSLSWDNILSRCKRPRASYTLTAEGFGMIWGERIRMLPLTDTNKPTSDNDRLRSVINGNTLNCCSSFLVMRKTERQCVSFRRTYKQFDTLQAAISTGSIPTSGMTSFTSSILLQS